MAAVAFAVGCLHPLVVPDALALRAGGPGAAVSRHTARGDAETNEACPTRMANAASWLAAGQPSGGLRIGRAQ